MAKDALALIKELAEKIDDLEYTLEVQGDNLANAREGWNDAECKVEKLTEENERLKQAHDMLNESYDHLEKTKDELLAERSRLVGESEKIGIDNFDLICELSRIKEDTVREFAERIKTRMDDFARKGSGEYTYYLISKSVIDQIAKKMLEVNDAAE